MTKKIERKKDERKKKREARRGKKNNRETESALTKKVEKIFEIKKILDIDDEVDFGVLTQNEIEILYSKLTSPTWILNLPEKAKKKMVGEVAKNLVGNVIEEHDGPILSMLKEAGDGKIGKGLLKNLIR